MTFNVDMQKMNPQQIALSYDALASHWDGDEFSRENGIKQHIHALRFSKTKGDAIDVGCGSSGRIIDLLLSKGFGNVEGADISQKMLVLARKRHPKVTFHHVDITMWDFPKQYDFISAWDSIWHVPLDQQEYVLRKICNALSDKGILIFTSGGVDTPEEGGNPFKNQPLYHSALGIPKLLDIIKSQGCILRHLEYDQAHGDSIDSHLYLIVQRFKHTMT